MLKEECVPGQNDVNRVCIPTFATCSGLPANLLAFFMGWIKPTLLLMIAVGEDT